MPTHDHSVYSSAESSDTRVRFRPELGRPSNQSGVRVQATQETATVHRRRLAQRQCRRAEVERIGTHAITELIVTNNYQTKENAMTATSYGELLHDVQQRARQLDTQLLTSATVSVALFGIIGGPWGAEGTIRNGASESLAVTFLIILSLSVFPSVLARPFVVPAPNHDSGTRSKAIGLELDENCVRSTAT